MNRLRLQITAAVLRRRGKDAFVGSLPADARVFDIGCGNESPTRMKCLRPDIHYIGIDVGDYNQSDFSKAEADEYIVAPPKSFADSIRAYDGVVDAIVSAHNLEHCDNAEDVLDAMASKLRPGGEIYIAYPCAESVGFPTRRGTLNFFDDSTHASVVDTDKVLAGLNSHAIDVAFIKRRYRPALPALLGLLLEPLSFLFKRNIPLASTWALYGFETVIWGRKQSIEG